MIRKVKTERKGMRRVKNKKELDGNTEVMVSTGSTLLDLAISGTRVKGGGLPGGIFAEIFGPSGSGKTVLLCEIAGAIKRLGGEIMFKDPEARLNKTFAQIFDLDVDTIDYDTPNTVPQVFKPVREWEPKAIGINGILADSFAALSTDMEMEDSDKYGMRRAKEFSEELRKTCRIITQKNFLMVASNQVRENIDAANKFSPKWVSPGGQAVPFYASIRLRMASVEKEYKKITLKTSGKEERRIIGVTTTVEVFKSSVDKPFRQAPVSIIFDYGIDDIRQNLVFVKKHTKSTTYTVNDVSVGPSLDKAILKVEELQLEKKLKRQTITLWEEVEASFESKRKPKRR
jgi:recombination protein RecA